MGRRKYLYGCILGCLLLLCSPVFVSASSGLPVKSYKVSDGSWKKDSGGQWYFQLKNKKRAAGWTKIGEKTYYFRKNGTMLTGWKSSGGRDYYLGSRSVGMVKGFYEDEEENLYYFDKTGAAKKGAFQIGSRFYYANPRTHALFRLMWTDKAGGEWHYFDGKGVRYSKWFTLGGKRYYCSPKTGRMKAGWRKVSGQYYCFEEKGNVKVNQWVRGRSRGQIWYVDGDGRVTSRKKDTAKNPKSYDQVILLGDSRFYRARYYFGISNSHITYVTEPGMGCGWMKKTAFPRVRRELVRNAKKKHPGKMALVMNLGVNDLKKIDQYLSFVNTSVVKLARQYDCDLYYVSVNPVDPKKFQKGSSAYKKRQVSKTKSFNRQIADFNGKLRKRLDPCVKYIDVFNYLKNCYDNDFSKITVKDGLHYNERGSQAIYRRILRTVRVT